MRIHFLFEIAPRCLQDAAYASQQLSSETLSPQKSTGSANAVSGAVQETPSLPWILNVEKTLAALGGKLAGALVVGDLDSDVALPDDDAHASGLPFEQPLFAQVGVLYYKPVCDLTFDMTIDQCCSSGWRRLY